MDTNDIYLFDSSTWINHFKQNSSKSSDLLYKLLDERENVVVLCPIVVHEILQGLKLEEQFKRISILLNSYYQLPCGHYKAAFEASKIYFDLRKKGVTIRKANDCLIAWYAMEYNLILAHDNKDFEEIKKHFTLKTFH